MVDYSKWDNLESSDSDSASDSGHAATAAAALAIQRKRQGAAAPSVKQASDKRALDQAEVLRLQGNSAYECGDVSKAIGAYDAQLRVLEGLKDDAAMEMTRGALLNQASGFIRLKKFGEAEARCTRLLDCTAPSGRDKVTDGGAATAAARTRALHFRGFARLQQGLFEGACSDLKSSLAAGTSSGDEARALLLEAEAGAALSSCRDPEAKGKELLRQGNGRESAKHFRDAASRASRRKDADADAAAVVGGKASSSSGGGAAALTLARNLRMEGVAIAMAGDVSSADVLLRAALRESRAGRRGGGVEAGGGGDGGGAHEEEGLALTALGSLLAQGGKHADAVKALREAVTVLDEVIAGASAKEGRVNGSSNEGIPPPPSSIAESRVTALTRTLTGTLTFLGTSLLALEVKPGPNDGSGSGGTARDPTKPGKETQAETDTVAGASCDGERPPDLAATAAAVTAGAVDGSPKEDDEAVQVLKRAHEILKNELAATAAVAPGQESGSAVVDLSRGGSRGEGEVEKQTAKVLDNLSEAYARGKHWERARSAAEQSLTAWRSLGEAGRAGAAASLLSLGHLLLQLHGVGAGIEEASARWEEATMCFNDCAERPSDTAEVRLKVAGYYTKVARSDPSRLASLEGKIAAHYAEAAGLFAREREEKTSSLKRSAAAVAAVEAPRNTVNRAPGAAGAPGAPGAPESTSPLPPSVVESLKPDGRRSLWELAEKEAFAWEGYAGAVGDDHETAAKALSKAEGLLNHASVSEKGQRWTLRMVGVLHGLALALARGGKHAMAEDKLLEAIRQLRELDGVDPDAEDCAHKGTLTDLYKYLAIARCARGDIPGAKEAVAQVGSLGGGEGHKDVEELNRLMAGNATSFD